MKIIFLDIDGVLNSTSGTEPYISDMEVDKLVLLKQLIDISGSFGIVIISDRRYSEIDMRNKIFSFNKYGIKVIGCLRNPNDDLNDSRGKQIMDYLADSKEEIERMVILDDNDDGISVLFEKEFILVNKTKGLNLEAYNQALQILSA